MRMLVVGEKEKKAIAELRELAKAERLSREHLEKYSQGFDPNDPKTRKEGFLPIAMKYTICLPDGFTVTYTEEDQPIGMCRHLSVSVDADGKLPNPSAIEYLLYSFGFEHKLGVEQVVYPEEYGEGLTAVNVIERISS